MRISVPKLYREFASVFGQAGYRCYFVGGAVRDAILGGLPDDWDAATDARPEDVRRLFRSVIPTGIQHGTVTVLWRGTHVETTTFRVEGRYQDGRRPLDVRFTDELVDDLSRRDFTINGMAVDPDSGEVIDPHGGLADLKAGIIRAIGDPLERFAEDGLRCMRAVRFAARLGFSLDPATRTAIPERLSVFQKVSAERVRDELSKILLSGRPALGLGLLESTGLLPLILPELSACRGVGQGGPHRFDVLDHVVASCQAAEPELVQRLSALLHDLGKPACRVEGADGGLAFHGHDTESARLSEVALKRLKYPNDVVNAVVTLVRNHMFDYRPDWTDAAVRRFVNRVGMENVLPLARLRLADLSGVRGEPADPRVVLPLVDRVNELKAKDQAFTLRDLAIGGDELARLGWPKGPVMGRVLAELLDTVLDDPGLNTRERLTSVAQNLKGKYGIE